MDFGILNYYLAPQALCYPHGNVNCNLAAGAGIPVLKSVLQCLRVVKWPHMFLMKLRMETVQLRCGKKKTCWHSCVMFSLGFVAKGPCKNRQVRAVARYCHQLIHVSHNVDVPLFQQHLKGVHPLMTLTVAAATFGVAVSQHWNIFFFNAIHSRIRPGSKRSIYLQPNIIRNPTNRVVFCSALEF